MLGLISKDDPPVYLSSSGEDRLPQNHGEYLHSFLHAKALKAQCDKMGVEAVLTSVKEVKSAEASGGESGGQGAIDFLFKYLKSSGNK